MSDALHDTLAMDAVLEALANEIGAERGRLLLFGEPGVGKSALADRIARALAARGQLCQCISADPGSPALGPPGALALGAWSENGWRVLGLEALCTLDAARYRLPLVRALERLLVAADADATLLLDPPGLVRGAAAAELLLAICECAEIDMAVVLVRDEGEIPLHQELCASGVSIRTLTAAKDARRPPKGERERSRTEQWNAFLAHAVESVVNLDEVRVIGMPPTGEQWRGRQIALLRGGACSAMGEVVSVAGQRLNVRTERLAAGADTLLVRDAVRTPRRGLHTAATAPMRQRPPAFVEATSPLATTVGSLSVTLVNGVFGDPLLQLRFKHLRRSILFDLGDAVRVSARIAHQVSDVFLSHAHFDHIAGFLWLLRARLSGSPPCAIYGPPGIAGHIEHLIGGIHWDRIDGDGPEFLIHELHRGTRKSYRIQVGQELQALDEAACADGILLAERDFSIRAVTLDHGIPVLAFAFESASQVNIRRERLHARNLEPGPWLGELKERLLAGEPDAPIELPDGSTASAAALGEDLVLVTPGRKLVYATDFADTAINRDTLAGAATQADVLVCEATFTRDDAEQALRTQHLTARACGEIATRANVARLMPFHFSKRYEHDPTPVYAELAAAFRGTILS